ncbi:uncharacterized protein LOC6527586 [Drosophila yakuba]|uniref:Peptidase M13 N-terminal domain-containing protein n=1 Tax=Drosophila yakuba TaxID=7245 RepID=B4P3T5_DROYA|nr:uncharacterized protein LOC6527586 [Drosophila yakuba]EDW88386.1 uncharacterized protein Dyak_GE18699 [Drosophila yakuba]
MMASTPLLTLSWLLLLGSAVCSTNSNLKIMERMLGDMDEKAEPCQNFYNSSQKNLQWAEFPTVSEEFQLLFDGIENEVFKEHSFEHKLQRFYKICLTKERPSQLKFFELVPLGEDINWPFLTPAGSEWPKEKFQWTEALAQLRRYGINDVMFGMSVRPDADSGQPIVIFEKKYDFLLRFMESMQNVGLPPHLAKEIAPLDKILREVYTLDMEWEHKGNRAPGHRISLRELENYGVSLTKYLEIVFRRPFSPDFVVQVDNLYYLMGLQEVMTTVPSHVVAKYLAARFNFYIVFTFMKHGGSCVTSMRHTMEFASNLLFEERVLGRKKLRSYQNQAGKIFDAMRKQLHIRLERNSLELPAAEISSLQKKLNGLSLSIGNLPGKAGHRRFVTRFYKDLEFADDETSATAHLKVLEHRTRAELRLLDQSNFNDRRYVLHYIPISNNFFETAIEENGNTIYVAYDLLADASFDPDSHEIFKMTPLGIRFAFEMLKSLNLYNCKRYKLNMLKMFDDNQIITAGDDCQSVVWSQEMADSQRDQYLVMLQLAYEAYFAEDSKFSQRQPNFTTIPLRKLFFFRFGQSSFGKTLYSISDFVEGGPPINSFTRMPVFVRAFNCLAPEQELK